MENHDILNWIQSWYKTQCNGDWEHSFGIKIDTLDNPGWSITIDLAETKLADFNVPYQLIEHSASDWYSFSLKDAQYNASGDPTKLELLLLKFRDIVENKI